MSIIRNNRLRALVGLGLGLGLASGVHAQAVADARQAQTVTSTGHAATVEHLPGFNRVIMAPVTPEESEKAVLGRPLKEVNIGVAKARSQSSATGGTRARVVGDAAPTAPASIAELARALRGDPDLIYEYVRNNIEYVPIWGIQKGDFGTLLDNQGTSFDQAALMVSLLRQSGYTASFVKGRISLTAAQITDWLGIDTNNACGVLGLFANGQIPYSSIGVSASFSCPTTTTALNSLKLDHVWVKVLINGTAYYFDPSYKPHARKAGINLATATGYNAATFMSGATTGATITADYVQGINRTNVRASLTTYANNLASYLRTNLPAGTLDDVVGGRTITPHNGTALRQTTLPYQDTTVALTEWTGDVPQNYKPTLRIQYQGIDRTFTSDAIYGRRLTLTYNTSNQPVLSLDGTALATGTAATLGSYGNVTMTIAHGAYAQALANQSFTQQIKVGGTFLIGNAWGPVGRGPIELHRRRLDQAIASGASATSEAALGSSLAVLASTWTGQVNHSAYITDRMARTNTLQHHQVGIAGYDKASYVDLPGVAVSVVSQDADRAKEAAVFFSEAMHSSIFESTAVQQVTSGSAVSTVKLIDMAVAANQRIYDAKSANFAGAVQPNLVGCTNYIASFQSAINAGRRLILPGSCTLNEGSWTGFGFYNVLVSSNGYSVGSIISGGMAGGFATTPLSASLTNTNSLTNSLSTQTLTPSTGKAFGDPIDMTKGNYLYSHTDITTGVGDFPASLSFDRAYTSGNRTQGGPLGLGWSSSAIASLRTGSDGFQGMGEDSALDAAAIIAEKLVALDVLADTNKPVANMVIATLGQRWFGEQLTNNTVIVSQGTNGDVFVKLADGSYSAPPGKAAKLTRNADNSYNYETVHKSVLNFNPTGQLATFTHPSGIQAKYTYTSNLPTKIENSLGRSLTLTYTSGRITSVSDGSRSVSFGYDASGNLASYTDALGKATTYQYDLPGRMTKLFFPTAPTTPFITNVYDSLGRVQTQTSATGKLYTYYFAGSRSEELGPYNVKRVSYVDINGNVLKAIDPLGKVVLNTYDGQTRLVKTVLPEGNSVEYNYDDAPCAAQKRCTHNVKAIRQVAKPGSGLPTLTASFTYESSFNLVATSTNPRGQVTSITYTAQGMPLTTTAPKDKSGVSPVTTYGYTSYTPANFPAFYLQTSVTTQILTGRSVIDRTAYDTTNKYVPLNMVRDSGGLNLLTTFTYDAIGNLTKVDGPRTDVTDVTSTIFDAERRPTQVTNALNKLTRYFYDADGRLVRSAAQIGTQWLTSCSTFGVNGKVSSSWGPALTASDTVCPTAAAPVPVTDYSYDDLDRQIRVKEYLPTAEGGNRVTDTAYNLDNSVQSTSRAVGTALAQVYATYTYTANGKRAAVRDANKNLTTYEYDGHDRLVKTRFPDKVTANTSSTTDVETYAYDNNGNVTSAVRRNGQAVATTFDNLDRVIARTYPNTADNVEFAYDLQSKPLTARFSNASHDLGWTYDNAGRALTAVAGGKTLTYQYDPAGNQTRIIWPDSFYVTRSFDALNRPVTVSESGNVNLATYAYDDLSRRTTVTLGNGTKTSYGYSAQSSMSSLAHDFAGTAQDVSWTFARNQAQQITSTSWSNDLYQWNGVTNGTRSNVVNGLNQYTTVAGAAIGYDANGNITGDGTWTYGYDIENRLKSASKTGVTASLSYDVLGRLRRSVINSNTIDLLYSGTALVGEYDSAGTLLRRYVTGSGVDEVLVQYNGTGTTNKTWLYADQLGSVVASANSAGTAANTYTYGPYGEPNTSTGPRFRYTGQQYLSELGLTYYKARFYSPALGRFLQTDPVGYAAGLNLYAYVDGDPINLTDPTGNSPSENGLGDSSNVSFGASAASIGLDALPVVGSFKSAIQAVTGSDLITGEDVSRVGEVVGMAAGLVPGGKALLKGRKAVKVLKAESSAEASLNLAQDAKKVMHELNGNKTRVTIKEADKWTHYDLAGAAHKGVETPHVQFSYPNLNPHTGQVFFNKDKEFVRPMTAEDLDVVVKYLAK